MKLLQRAFDPNYRAWVLFVFSLYPVKNGENASFDNKQQKPHKSHTVYVVVSYFHPAWLGLLRVMCVLLSTLFL